MEKKRIAVLAVFSVFLISGFLFYLLVYQQAEIQGNAISGNLNNTHNETATDSHGCLIHQGFTWNETEQACVREWISPLQTSRYQKNFILGKETQNSFYNNSINETINWTTYVNITNIGNPTKINLTQNQSSLNKST